MSVIVPMYNTRKYIWTCIESIFEQTFQDFEIILIDDCSTDGSLEFVLDHFHDNRLQIFRNRENFGTGYTLNFGIKNSIGDYIYILDSDDAILPETLETLLKTAEEYSADVVHMSLFNNIQDPNFELHDKNVLATLEGDSNYTLGIQTNDIRKRLLQIGRETKFPAWHNFFRGKFLREKHIFEPEIRSNVDVYFLIAVLCLAEKIVKIDQPLYLYRGTRSESITNSKTEVKFSRFVQSLPERIRYLRKLFERDDLIGKVSYEWQMQFEAYVFYNHIKNLNLQNLPVETRCKIISKFYDGYLQPEVMKDFLQIFFETALQELE